MKKKPLSPEQALSAKKLKAIFEAKKKELGLSQEILADKMGIGQSAVAQLLNGSNAIGPSHAAQFAKILEVRINDFSESLASEISEMHSYIKNEVASVRPVLTPEQNELIKTFSALPDDKKEKFMREMKAMKAHYDAYFEQRLRESHGKAS